MNHPRNLVISAVMAVAGMAYAHSSVPAGTEVILRFDQPVNSRHVRAGDTIKLEVAQDVMNDNGRVVIHAGEPVTGVIETVDKNGHYGKNAKIRIAINPIDGIPVEPRDKGKEIGGTRTDEAAAATGGAALVFGPLGLAAGYFIVGKPVVIHTGQHLRTVVSKTVWR